MPFALKHCQWVNVPDREDTDIINGKCVLDGVTICLNLSNEEFEMLSKQHCVYGCMNTGDVQKLLMYLIQTAWSMAASVTFVQQSMI